MTVDPFTPPNSEVIGAPDVRTLTPLCIAYTTTVEPTEERLKAAFAGRSVWGRVAVGLVFMGGGLAGSNVVLLVVGAWIGWPVFRLIGSAIASPHGPPGTRVPFTFNVNEAGVSVRAEREHQQFDWKALSYFEEVPGAFLIVSRKDVPVQFEKRHATLAEQADLRAWLERQLPEGARNARGRGKWGWVVGVWLLLIAVFWAIYHYIAANQ